MSDDVWKGGDVKRAAAALLTWEAEEDQDGDEDEDEEGEGEGEESESESESESETDEESTSSGFAELEEKYGHQDGEQQTKMVPAEHRSGKYVLKAIVGVDRSGLWTMVKRDGILNSREGTIGPTSSDGVLEGMRLEFWERL